MSKDESDLTNNVEYYRINQKSLKTKDRVGDVHGMASTWANLGLLYLRTGRAEEGKPLLARAYRVLVQMGSPDAQAAAQALVRTCGSQEAANRYLAQIAQEETSKDA